MLNVEKFQLLANCTVNMQLSDCINLRQSDMVSHTQAAEIIDLPALCFNVLKFNEMVA